MAERAHPLDSVVSGLEALLVKLAEVDEATREVFTLAHIHGMGYSGPTYEVEYARARAALQVARQMRDAELTCPEDPSGHDIGWYAVADTLMCGQCRTRFVLIPLPTGTPADGEPTDETEHGE